MRTIAMILMPMPMLILTSINTSEDWHRQQIDFLFHFLVPPPLVPPISSHLQSCLRSTRSCNEFYFIIESAISRKN